MLLQIYKEGKEIAARKSTEICRQGYQYAEQQPTTQSRQQQNDSMELWNSGEGLQSDKLNQPIMAMRSYIGIAAAPQQMIRPLVHFVF